MLFSGTTQTKLIDYLKMNNISRIISIGDSQGSRYNAALFGLLAAANVKCKLIKTESNSYQPGKGYFTQGTNIKTNAIIASARTCHSCMSTLHVCTSQQLGRKLELEYISMMMVANATIVPNKLYCQANVADPVCKVKTQQEFLFKIYLKDRYPDLVFIYGTFGHDRMKSIPFIDRAIHHVIDVIRDSLPSSSKTVWLTSSATYLKKVPPKENKARFEHGWTFDEKVQACNWLLFHALKSELELLGQSKMYGFFDLHSMSTPVQPFWSEDFVHLSPLWYKYVMEYMFAMLEADNA